MGMGCGKYLRERGNSNCQKVIPIVCKGARKVTWKQMWFNLIADGTPPEKIGLQPHTVLVSLWKVLKSEQQFRPAPLPPLFPMPHLPQQRPQDTEPLVVGSSHILSVRCMPRLPPGEGLWR